MSRVKKFRVSNVGPLPVTFNFDKKLLGKSGFTTEPESIQKLPGAPDFESVVVTVTFQTAKLEVGRVAVTSQLDLFNGPSVLCTFAANVVTPELSVSSDTLDFGRVQVGTCKVVTVKLHNPTVVPLDFSIRKPLEAVKDWPFFVCTPTEGSLPPGGWGDLKIEFTPNAPRSNFAQRIPIKIGYNPRLVYLQCKAAGFNLEAVCEPAVLDLGAIMPVREKKGRSRSWPRANLIRASVSQLASRSDSLPPAFSADLHCAGGL